MQQPEQPDPKKIPLNYGDFGQASQYNDIVGMICRKKGQVSVEFCGQCPEFEPAVSGLKEGDKALERMDGIDPHTGNSYATCKYFGEMVRVDPFYAMVRRIQERRFGRW
jgi:hypothetical protein